MNPAVLQRTLLVLVLLAGQLTGALHGLGHVRDAVASVAACGHHHAVASVAAGHDAHPLDGYCHACLTLATVAPPPVLFGAAAAEERVAGGIDELQLADVHPAATRHRLARGPPALS